jgi:hypothetical protein
MPDAAQARALTWEADGARAAFSGEHRGFDPIVHRRNVALDGAAGTLTIDDEVGGGKRLQWSFPLAPGASVAVDGTTATAQWSGAVLEIAAPEGVDWTVEDGWVSPGYGRRERAPVLRARSGPRSVARFVLRAHRYPL